MRQPKREKDVREENLLVAKVLFADSYCQVRISHETLSVGDRTNVQYLGAAEPPMKEARFFRRPVGASFDQMPIL